MEHHVFTATEHIKPQRFDLLCHCLDAGWPSGIEAMAQKVEALGFDVLGCGEHVMFHGDTANGFVSLATAAGATSKIKLMSAITLVPLYPAALLANNAAG